MLQLHDIDQIAKVAISLPQSLGIRAAINYGK